jgi:hypothetical protein
VKGELVITPLAKAVPDEVEDLTRQAYALLPRIKLPELLLEVNAWTGLDRHFTHLHTGEPPKDRTALFATLLADAINLGLSKMAETCAGMTFNRLAWVADWNVRDETYTKALAEVINYTLNGHDLRIQRSETPGSADERGQLGGGLSFRLNTE